MENIGKAMVGQPMIADKTVITTEVRIDKDIVENIEGAAVKLGVQAWIGHGREGGGTNVEPNKAGGVSTKDTVPIGLCHGAIRLGCTRDDGGFWYLRRIELNAAKLLFGHNGEHLTEEEFSMALGITRKLVGKLLVFPGDRIHLVPGVDPKSHAYWRSIETFVDLPDTDGSVLLALSNAKSQLFRKCGYHYKKESRVWGDPKRLCLRVYRKDLQLAERFGHIEGPDDTHVIRVEVVFTGEKLVRHLGSGDGRATTADVDGKVRVVRFSGKDLIRAHQGVVHTLEGLYPKSSGNNEAGNGKVGRFIGVIAQRHCLDLEPLVAIWTEANECTRKTECAILRAARASFAARTRIRPEHLFRDAAYVGQPTVRVPGVGWKSRELREMAEVEEDIRAVYRREPTRINVASECG